MRIRWAAVALGLFLGAGALAKAQPPAPEARADVSNAAQLIGPPSGRPLGGATLEAETKRVGALLRCPVCQGLSVADSPASMAVNMRRQVEELLASGYTEEQILRYFERSYGEFVLLDPPLRGVNWTLWLAPAVGLLVGGGVVAWLMLGARRAALARQPAPRSEEPRPRAAGGPAEDPVPEDAELARYVLRVRELAYGWPDGVRPGKAER